MPSLTCSSRTWRPRGPTSRAASWTRCGRPRWRCSRVAAWQPPGAARRQPVASVQVIVLPLAFAALAPGDPRRRRLHPHHADRGGAGRRLADRGHRPCGPHLHGEHPDAARQRRGRDDRRPQRPRQPPAADARSRGSPSRDADEHHPQTLVFFDLNGFKRYNDTFGHAAGDALLARLGARPARRRRCPRRRLSPRRRRVLRAAGGRFAIERRADRAPPPRPSPSGATCFERQRLAAAWRSCPTRPRPTTARSSSPTSACTPTSPHAAAASRGAAHDVLMQVLCGARARPARSRLTASVELAATSAARLRPRRRPARRAAPRGRAARRRQARHPRRHSGQARPARPTTSGS